MQKKSLFFRIFIPLTTLLVVWVLFYISSVFLTENQNKNLSYFPTNSLIKIRIDGKKIVEKTAGSLLFDSKDEKVLTQLDTLLGRMFKDTTQAKKMGINFLSDIGIFTAKQKDGILLGFLVNVNNEKLFNSNVSKSIGQNQASYYKDGVGTIVQYIPMNLNGQTNISSIAQNILNKKGVNPFNTNENKDVIMEIISTNASNYKNPLGTGKLAIWIEDQKIKMEGNLDKPSTYSTDASYTLKTRGLNISINAVDPSWNRIIASLLEKQSIKIPEIKSLSFNYQGVNLEEGGDQGFYVQPKMDLLLNFKNAYNVDSTLSALDKLNGWGVKRTEKQVKVGTQVYSIKSIDSKTLFLGTNPQLIKKSSKTDLYKLEGDLGALTDIKGAGFIISFLEMMPPYSATKTLFGSIENSSIIVTQSKNSLDFKGSILFKKDKHALTEFVRFGLLLKGIQ